MDWGTSVVEDSLSIDGVANTSVATGGSLNGPVIDVRQWASYYFTLTGTRNGVATNYNPIAARLLWYADSAGTIPIYADTYEIFAFRSTAPFNTMGGRLYGQDTLHGPFMQVFLNNIGPDTCDINYSLIGTTRAIPGPYFREMSQDLPPNIYIPDNFIVDPATGNVPLVAAGADYNLPGLMRYGRAKWRISTSQNFGIFFQAGSLTSADIEAQGPLAAGIYSGELLSPKRSLLITVHNNGAVNMNFLFNMITENEKF